MIPLTDWLNMSWVVGAILVLMAGVELWRILDNPPVENTRKLAHLGSGFISLSFAFLFSSHWTVLVLCVLFVVFMFVTKALGILKSIHAVQRKSYGVIYFPLATYLTFLFAWFLGQPLFYFIAIAVLSTSDTIAAIVGRHYGLNLYETQDEMKSLEGSVMFFLSCYLIVHITLLLGTDISRINSVLIAFWVAFLVTLFEAISIKGADNFWIPIGTYYLLWKIVPKDTQWVVTELIFLAASVLISLLVMLPKRKLNMSAIAGVGLLLYSSMRLPESWNWGIAILTAMLLFNYSGMILQGHLERKLQIRAILYSLGATAIWVVVGNLLPTRYESITVLPFLTTLGAILSIGWKESIQNLAAPPVPLSAVALKYTGLLTLFMTLLVYIPQLFFHEHLRRPVSFILYITSVFLTDCFTAWLFYRNPHWTPLGKVRVAFCITLAVSCLVFFIYARLILK